MQHDNGIYAYPPCAAMHHKTVWTCHNVCLQVYERALPYFELAAAIQPKEVKWSLMVASCYRRIGAYDQALRRCASKQYPEL